MHNTAEYKGRIGILGGTFDPVHNAHLELATAALSEGKLRKLIVLPAYIQPFKMEKKVSDEEHRMNMVKLAFEDKAHIEISDFEILKACVSYTYETLCDFRKIYPDDELFFITGADSFLQIEKWHMGPELLEAFSFMVSLRPGYREKELKEMIELYRNKYGTQTIEIFASMPDISSTFVRERVIEGLPIDEYVPKKVERYIYDYGLYQGD